MTYVEGRAGIPAERERAGWSGYAVLIRRFPIADRAVQLHAEELKKILQTRITFWRQGQTELSYLLLVLAGWLHGHRCSQNVLLEAHRGRLYRDTHRGEISRQKWC